MRLIDADALVEECEEVCKRLEKLDDGIFCPAHYTLEGVRTIIHRIEKQPTRRADGTVEDGYWIKGYREWSSGRREDIYWCSQCKRINETKLTHCPYCGATMNADRKTENSSEIPNNCEDITEDGVTCAKYPACDDCLDNPLNKVKGSERLLKGKDEPQTDCAWK